MKQTEEAIHHTDATSSRVNTGVTFSQEAAEKVEQIRSGTDEIAVRMAEITSSTKEQSSATTMMAQSAERVNVKSMENTKNLQHILDTITTLAHRGQDLIQLVAQFKL